MEVREVAPPAPPTHIDQVVGELQTMEPAVQDPPEAGAAGAGAGAAGADGFAETGITTFPPVGPALGAESALVALGKGAGAESGVPEAPPEAGLGVGAAGAGAPEPEPPETPPAPPSNPAPASVLMVFSPLTTSAPGLGKSTFTFSLVLQPWPMLQVNMSGKELMPPCRAATSARR